MDIIVARGSNDRLCVASTMYNHARPPESSLVKERIRDCGLFLIGKDSYQSVHGDLFQNTDINLPSRAALAEIIR